MVEAGKKVNYYRLALRRGRMHRMEVSEDDRLVGQGGGVFSYLAPVFDSADYECTWHRLRLEGVFTNCKYEIIAAATDVNLQEILGDEKLAAAQQLQVLKEYGHIRKVNVNDMLLHSLQGRYLWVMINVAGARTDSHFRIEGFSVEFPQTSFVEYLPEIYQQGRDSFFERYMAVFQSMYEDLEKEVDKLPQYLDYQTTSENNLPILAEWAGGRALLDQWTPKQLRMLIGNLQKIQSGRGTWTVMEQMIWLLTGQKAVIVEYFSWRDWMRKQSTLFEEYHQLFGNDEDTFAVIIDATEKEPEISERKLEEKLQDYTPLGMNCKVIYLRKSSYMDKQCYLDKNSYLSVPETPTTEGFFLGGNFVLG